MAPEIARLAAPADRRHRHLLALRLLGGRDDRPHRPHWRGGGPRSRPALRLPPRALARGGAHLRLARRSGDLRPRSRRARRLPAAAAIAVLAAVAEARGARSSPDPPPASRALAPGDADAGGRGASTASCSGSASRPSCSPSASGRWRESASRSASRRRAFGRRRRFGLGGRCRSSRSPLAGRGPGSAPELMRAAPASTWVSAAATPPRSPPQPGPGPARPAAPAPREVAPRMRPTPPRPWTRSPTSGSIGGRILRRGGQDCPAGQRPGDRRQLRRRSSPPATRPAARPRHLGHVGGLRPPARRARGLQQLARLPRQPPAAETGYSPLDLRPGPARPDPAGRRDRRPGPAQPPGVDGSWLYASADPTGSRVVQRVSEPAKSALMRSSRMLLFNPRSRAASPTSNRCAAAAG